MKRAAPDRSRMVVVAPSAGDPVVRPMILDEQGTLRFRENAIVCHLLDDGPFTMNDLAVGDYSIADREEFLMLIGYSVEGFSEISYVTDATFKRVSRRTERITKKEYWTTKNE